MTTNKYNYNDSSKSLNSETSILRAAKNLAWGSRFLNQPLLSMRPEAQAPAQKVAPWL